jgi:hypothetical protein
MWDRITRIDFQRARLVLDQKRAELLSKHAEEIEQSDAQLRHLESFDRVVSAFFEEYHEYLIPQAPESQLLSAAD